MTWTIDQAHSHVQFSARHMMISTVRGEFEEFSGTIDFNEENPEESAIHVKIDASSINTREEDRDNHLRSDDFLHAEEYPYLIFESKEVEQLDDDRGRVIGDLTIRGVTNEVVLDVKYHGMAKSPWGQTSAGFSASTTINRKDWGLTWNQALETGGVLVGDKIKIDIEVELIRQEQEEEEAVPA
ncbi:MAG TPA: YceI family protein [Candidatus Sulfomarinibacteraceae bacterium]|nr:YceI family protein [Candidatus Sulfomarinibacteraceae bacterium]